MPASSFVARDHAGGAVDTTISTTIIGTDLSITIVDATGWPTGGANGPFHVIASYDVAGREKIEVQSRTGNVLTIADTGKRGIDGTAAQGHAAGAKIRHCYTAIDAQEANDHITNTGLDHHTQYLTSGRHSVITHTQGMLGTDSVGSAQIQAGAVGSSELGSAAVTAGKIATGGISAAAQFAAGVVDAAAIAADAVGSSEIAALAVGSAELAAGAVIAGKIGAAAIDDQSLFSTDTQPFIVQAGDPGAVGANKIWFDTTARIIKVRNAGNSGWDIYSRPQTDWAEYNPVFGGVTLGTGGYDWGYWRDMGDFIYVTGGFELGSLGDVTAGIDVTLPVNAKNPALAVDVNNRFRWEGAARAQSGSALWAGIGVIAPTVDAGKINTFATAGSNGWAATDPFNWGAGDRLVFFIAYEPA